MTSIETRIITSNTAQPYSSFNETAVHPYFPENNTDEVLKKESIFEYYNILNEVDFITRYDLPAQQKEYYLRENVLRFLSEFAGNVPYSKITYILREDGLYYGNLRVSENYRATAQAAGATTSEKAEAQGFEQIENSFLRPSKQLGKPATTACWISPPKIANYGFVFYLAKDARYDEYLRGYRVTEYILRYPERMGEVLKSSQIFSGVNNQQTAVDKRTNDDFLTNPIVKGPNDNTVEFNNVLSLAGINERSIEKSQLFETLVEKELANWIDKYIACIFAISNSSQNLEKHNEHLTEAKRLMTALFNRAKEIKHIADEPQNYFATPQPANVDQDMIISHYADQQSAEVKGGGSCPVVKKKGGRDGFLPSTDIYSIIDGGSSIEQYISGGNSIEEYINSDSSEYYKAYKCESEECGEMIPGEKKGSHPLTWRTNCPHCNVEIKSCR